MDEIKKKEIKGLICIIPAFLFMMEWLILFFNNYEPTPLAKKDIIEIIVSGIIGIVVIIGILAAFFKGEEFLREAGEARRKKDAEISGIN